MVTESDQGPHFVGDITKQMYKGFNIEQCLHIAYHPESSGLVECMNRMIKVALRKVRNNNGKDWGTCLLLMLMALCGMESLRSHTPHLANTSREMQMPESWFLTNDLPMDFVPMVCSHQWVNSMLKMIKEVQMQVAHNLRRNQQVTNKCFSPLKIIEWDIGMKVMVCNFKQQHHCLSPLWEEPYIIVDKASPTVYGLEMKRNEKRVLNWYHSSQLKEWKGA